MNDAVSPPMTVVTPASPPEYLHPRYQRQQPLQHLSPRPHEDFPPSLHSRSLPSSPALIPSSTFDTATSYFDTHLGSSERLGFAGEPARPKDGETKRRARDARTNATTTSKTLTRRVKSASNLLSYNSSSFASTSRLPLPPTSPTLSPYFDSHFTGRRPSLTDDSAYSPSFSPTYSPTLSRTGSIKGKQRAGYGQETVSPAMSEWSNSTIQFSSSLNIRSGAAVGLAIEMDAEELLGAARQNHSRGLKKNRKSMFGFFSRRTSSSSSSASPNIRDAFVTQANSPALLQSPISISSPQRSPRLPHLRFSGTFLQLPAQLSSSVPSSSSADFISPPMISSSWQAVPSSFAQPSRSTAILDAAELSKSSAPALRLDIPSSIPRHTTRIARSNSDSSASRTFPRSQSNVALSTSASLSLLSSSRSRPPSPLASPSVSPSSIRRPNSARMPTPSFFGAVASLLSSTSSSAAPASNASSTSSIMSRSRSNSSSVRSPSNGEVRPSEFGQLFGGGSGAAGRRRGMTTSAIGAMRGSSSSLSNGLGLSMPSMLSLSGSITGGGNATSDSMERAARSRTSTGASRNFSFSSTSLSSQSSLQQFQHPLSYENEQVELMTDPAPLLSATTSPTSPLSARTTKFSNEPNETVTEFVERLRESVDESEVGAVLSSSADSFFASSLAHYLSMTTDFTASPLDIALRKFLLDFSLPTESQEIDRLIESFANRYCACNPGLFLSSDTAHLLAFSLIMLGTDLWNANNKVKMTKREYVKNTTTSDADSVPEILLEYFYDQISAAAFVFGSDLSRTGSRSNNQSRVSLPEFARSASSGSFFSSKEKTKSDPYYLMSNNLMQDLRLDVTPRIPTISPFSFTGLLPFFNASAIHLAFSNAPILQLAPSIPTPSVHEGTPLALVPTNTTYHVVTSSSATFAGNSIANLKITKVGYLNRKEDLGEAGMTVSKGNRGWIQCSLVLTASQLLIFKDVSWAAALADLVDDAIASRKRQVISPPRGTNAFKPDDMISLKDTIAIYDTSYSRHPNVFRLVLGRSGQQYLFQTSDSDELNTWLGLINYGASFKTVSIRMRDAANISDSSRLSERALSREELLSVEIASLDVSIQEAKDLLQVDLRATRNFAVLTPFSKSTKDRLDLAVSSVAKRVRFGRICLARLICYRQVLARDLLVDQEVFPRRSQHTFRKSSSSSDSLPISSPTTSPQQSFDTDRVEAVLALKD